MNEVFHVDQRNPSPEIVNEAATTLRQGGIVLLPTDTVYGLTALASKDACYGAQELFDIKHRPPGIPVPLLVAGIKDLEVYGSEVPVSARILAQNFWPGSLTIVIQASDMVLPEFRNKADGTVGLRCPDSALVREIIVAAGGPLFATSANTHGQPAPASFAEVEDRIKAAASLSIDGGPTMVGVPSTIVKCTASASAGGMQPDIEVLREGSIPAADLHAAVQSAADAAPAGA